MYGLLNIGQSALLNKQKAIDITGNNIANVDTPGYSRQTVVMEQSQPVRVNNMTMSTGVSTGTTIKRFYDQFLSAQLIGENETLGRWEAQKEALERTELMLDEASGAGLSNAMNQFWNAWQDLSNNPSGVAERTTMISVSQSLAFTFNQIYGNIDNLRQDIDSQVDLIVDDVNRLADSIANLNQKIVEVEASGHNANNFRDERDMAVMELSKLVNITSYEDSDGYLNIDTAAGRPLVQATTTWDLITANNGGVQDVYWENLDGTTVNITSTITGGELKGWIEARDTLLAGYLTQLDTLSNTFSSSVNTQHIAGRDLNNNAGLALFTGSGAGSIAVNTTIAADTDLIAAASAGEGLPGGNGNAIAIANLQNTATMAGSSTFSEYYQNLVGTVGADVQAADFNYNHQDSLIQGLEGYRQEVSGVSLDEEMINLVKFQHSYNAAARLITTADEILTTLLTLGT